jgi:hypothetical protein
MIQIFGLFFLIILLTLIYLAYSGRIHINIPLIFMFFILIASPFIYLGNKPNNNFENFSNWDNTMRSSLDIFYTNTKDNQPGTKNGCNECPGICDYNKKEILTNSLKKLTKIDNAVQANLKNITIGTVRFFGASSPGNVGGGYYSVLGGTKNNSSKSINISGNKNAITFQTLPISKLINFYEKYNGNNNHADFFQPKLLQNSNASIVVDLINELNNAPQQSYIIISSVGNANNALIAANNNATVNYNGTTVYSISLINKLITQYKLNYLNQIPKNNSFIFIIFKKNTNEYISINQRVSLSEWRVGLSLYQNLLSNGRTAVMEQTGQTFSYEKPETELSDVYSLPYVRAQYNIISPVNTKSDSSLCFSAENNKSFVFLAPKTNPWDAISKYSQSPSLEYGPVSATWLYSHQPQNWTFEPINEAGFTNHFYIRTFIKPYFYLQIKSKEPQPTISVNMFKGATDQHWIIEGNVSDNYTIKHSGTGLYLGYSNFGGYLYDDNGSVITTESKKYKWKFIPSFQTKTDIDSKKIKFNNQLTEIMSPTDYANEKNPSFNLAANIKGKFINLSSKGRTYWNPTYTPIWNGRWIYYGTIATYGQFKNVKTTKFLTIELNDNGKGTLTDKYFNYSIPISNIGSNVLYGTINKGILNGMTVYLEMIDEKLKYTNPSQSYPVKMRYLVFDSNNNIFNLSTGNFRNLEGYSSKFDGNFLVLSDFLEASGVVMEMNLSLPKAINDASILPTPPRDNNCSNGNRCEFADNQVLLGCGKGMNEDYVCKNAQTKQDRTRNNLADWAACPYQCDMENGKCLGNWRWQAEFDSNGTAVQCSPPSDGTKGYKQNIEYSPQYYLRSKN